MENTIEPSALTLANEHGIAIESIIPATLPDRLEKLRSILKRTDVPYPIDPDRARAYFELAESGAPFGIGSLSGETVDLAEYRDLQTYDSLTLTDHLSWACLVVDQRRTKHRYACREYLMGEEMFEIGGQVIPDYYLLNARIYQQTGWQLATVNEIIPAEVFFDCHSHRFFPVTTFMRPLGTDYLEEPDIGHDVAGHVATFTIPQVAQVMNNHGLANVLIHREKDRKLQTAKTPNEIQQIEDEATELLLYAGRLYWFTVEFGLVVEEDGLKAFGAGILSSPGETRYSVDAPDSNRILIDPSDDRDLLRLATTDYLISEFQKTYFVMRDFETLSSLTPERILKTIHAAQRLPHHTWREVVPGDDVINLGKAMMSPNEKYLRLMVNRPVDECLTRAAIRNLRMYRDGLNLESDLEREFVDALPEVSQEVLDWFEKADGNGEMDSRLS